jgi:hypothetical protein
VSVKKVDLSRFDAEAWDANAIRAGASMRSAYAHLRHVGLRFFLRAKTSIFQICLEQDGRSVPIGHYTLVATSRITLFYDGLNLYPEHAGLWSEAMQAALAQAGPGVYEYGWQWNIEPGREDLLAAMPGVRLQIVRPIMVQGVDFANWPSWDAYYGDISTNVRYDARRAEKTRGDLHMEISSGLATLFQAPRLVAMRAALYRRKGIGFRAWRVLLGYLVNTLICPSQAMIISAVADGRALAMQRDARFGSFHYHLDAAAAAGIAGEARYLQLAVLRRAYDLTPQGKFLMGYTDLPVEDQTAKGLLQSRRFLRVSHWPTTLIRFELARPR